MNIQLSVFDVAGTTVKDDDAVARTLLEVVADRGAAPSYSKICSVMGLAKPIAIHVLLSQGRCEPPTDSEVLRAHEAFEDRMVEHYLTSSDVSPIEGATETFRRLRNAGCLVALDTGFSRRVLSALLLRLGWQEGDMIDATVTSDEVERGRPFPDMVHLAMARTGVRDVDRVAKIGDTVADMREGATAQCGVVIGVLSGTGSREALRAERPTRIVTDIREVPDLVLGRSRLIDREARVYTRLSS
jgi:phosphonatase-like hydrolase